ncbi:MAG: hypothetical protein IJX81_05060 [Clostridia bacterium]|nr:hypothetical protein [Clostridia bacterium]
MNRTDEYLEKIRELNGLKHAVLSSITVDKRALTAQFCLITDRAYTQEEEERAKEISFSFLPKPLIATVRIVKRVPDEEGLRSRIYKFVCENFPAASAFLQKEDVKIQLLESGANFYFEIAAGDSPFFSSGRILDEVSAYLQTGYCGAFYGNVKIVERERDTAILDEVIESKEEEYAAEVRRFPIENFKRLDGADVLPTQAVYIADVALADGTFAVCGRVTYIEERTYIKHDEKTNTDVEKSRFSVTIEDGSGTLRCTYFPKKATVEKVRELKQGDGIVIVGSNEEYNGSVSFKAARINYGNPPEGFEPQAKKSKPVPKFYHTVFPEEYVDYTQAGLFDNPFKPAVLTQNTFVVFDLETTGLVHQPSMGKMDKIIEIGAVKIVNGELKEKFASFVACPDKLSPKIIELTGIHDEDLRGAPTVDKVVADFFKFVDGAYLVGHNVNFDYDFIKYYGGENGYFFTNRAFDTVAFAQEVLRGVGLANYKLNTIAAHYGFTFNHHRAYSDAAVTAKIFMELVKAKGGLPV